MADDVKEIEFQKSYYQKKRDAILSRRKERYLSDPAYRAAALQRAAEQKLRRKGERAKAAPTREVVVKGVLKSKLHSVNVGGATLEITMMSGGHLARKLGRTIQTIRMWEKKGILPAAMYRDPVTNARLYTEDQVQALVTAMKEATRKDGSMLVRERIMRTIFPRLAKDIWERWPVGVATD